MSRLLLSLLIVAAAASAAAAQVSACAPNADLDSKVYALWITDKTNPDEVPCAARLAPASCASDGAAETRVYRSADGAYAAVLRVSNGAVEVSISVAGAAGVGRGSAVLATYPYQRAVFRGIGADSVQMFDEDAQTTKTIGNVMLIPTENLTDSGRAMCPAS